MIWVFEHDNTEKVRRYLHDFANTEPLLPVFSMNGKNFVFGSNALYAVRLKMNCMSVYVICVLLGILGFLFMTWVPLMLALVFLVAQILLEYGLITWLLLNKGVKRRGLSNLKLSTPNTLLERLIG